MKKVSIALLPLAIGMAGAPVLAQARPTGEESLARMLVGRAAGAPVRCISNSVSRDMQIIDRTALVFGSGRLIYVNRPRNPRDLNSNHILVTRSHTGQLCRLDSVRLRDRSMGTMAGFISLGDFIPYRRNPSQR